MFSKFSKPPKASKPQYSTKRKVLMAVGIPAWAFFGFILSQTLVVLLIAALQKIGVPLDKINDSLFQVIAGGVVYALTLLVVIGLPVLVRKNRTSRETLGVHRLPTWMDIVWLLVGVVAYALLTRVVTSLAMVVLPFIDFNQVQDTGFTNVTTHTELILAFIMLVLVAPVSEELLFRGYVLGKLRKYTPLWVSILITSLLFAIVHFAWNVGVDVFALSIVLCVLRVVSGSLWPSILLHMLKNSVAFYFLFIDPSVLSTLVR